jgi:cellular nucleic acid-binding protein
MASSCPNEGICRNCSKSGHIAKDCTAPRVPPREVILYSNCYKPGHLQKECTNEKACNNCRQSGHIARNCTNDPVCNLCNVAGHLTRECPKADTIMERGGPVPIRGGSAPYHGGSALFRSSYSDVICRSCHQVGHMSRDCMPGAFTICHNCGGRGTWLPSAHLLGS